MWIKFCSILRVPATETHSMLKIAVIEETMRKLTHLEGLPCSEVEYCVNKTDHSGYLFTSKTDDNVV